MARHCPKLKRKKDATWFRDKVLLVEAQGSGKVLNEEELEFLADLRVAEGLVTQTVITHNATYQANDLDAYDSNCDDFSTAKDVLMANLSSYESNVLSEVEFRRISLTGFRSCTRAFLCPDTIVRLPMDIRLKINLGKSVGSHKSPTKSLFDVGSSRISIFTVKT
ncbi:hypothetical protein Tco_0560873 [Tanacetum coccineum]